MGLFGKKRKEDKGLAAAIESAVAAVRDPNNDQTLGEAGAVERVDCQGETCQVDIVLDYPPGEWESELVREIEQAAQATDDAISANVTVAFVAPEGSAMHGKPLPGVKNIIAVASGKGGVGKSSTS
ncbi:MAG: iron-sulfur cluster assembly protein, partial [Guyparkeria sp.]